MGPLEQRVMGLLEPTVTALGYELLGVEYLAQGKHSRLRVYIDSPDGIGLEDCETVSHQVSGVLDVDDPIQGQYSLEVSSPGMDRPLFRPDHFARFVGGKVKLRLSRPLNGQRNFHGRIDSVKDGEVYISMDDGGQLAVSIEDIEKANLVPEF
ncbi:MAG: ribosome maturation factor RimP [Gammaproteobacteria bacterium]|nr:ribosome maturation factor RimP [Gammaproteobacteria bacterium]